MSADIDVAFCRMLLRQLAPEVKAIDPKINVFGGPAWVYNHGRDHWEFHFGDFYWHGTAGNAYDARYSGWSAWLAERRGPSETDECACGHLREEHDGAAECRHLNAHEYSRCSCPSFVGIGRP